MSDTTLDQYRRIARQALEVFSKKTLDYGTSWRVLRPISVVDQLMIKVLRIRNLQDGREQRIADSVESEFQGIFNYSIIGLVQWQKGYTAMEDLPLAEAQALYEAQLAHCEALMLAKNHDYGEAWRDMSMEGLADLILVKLLRIKQILANDGQTLISEGVDANYADIANYAAFALILSGDAGA